MNKTRATALIVVGGLVAIGALLNALWIYALSVQPYPAPTPNWAHAVLVGIGAAILIGGIKLYRRQP
jgi:hypothetical protein